MPVILSIRYDAAHSTSNPRVNVLITTDQALIVAKLTKQMKKCVGEVSSHGTSAEHGMAVTARKCHGDTIKSRQTCTIKITIHHNNHVATHHSSSTAAVKTTPTDMIVNVGSG